MKAPIPFLILLHAVVVHCLKVVSKRGSGKSSTSALMNGTPENPTESTKSSVLLTDPNSSDSGYYLLSNNTNDCRGIT